MDRFDVAVIGLGYVGLPTACLLSTSGHRVYGHDIDPAVVAALSKGETPLSEPAVKALVKQAAASNNFTVGTALRSAAAYIICVPTPLRPGDKKPDLTLVDQAAKLVATHAKLGDLVVLESTSPVGTTTKIVAEAIRRGGLDPLLDVDICYCPERVLPGNTVAEIVNNDRIIGGMTERAARAANDLYRSFCHGPTHLTDATTAELCKLMENSFRDVNIALANSFAGIAEDAAIDVWEAISLANLHPRVNFLNPGPGVGGHCIPVDPWFLVHDFPGNSELLAMARTVNDSQPRHLAEMALHAGLTRRSRAAILGAAYRADIDDARESPTIGLIDILSELECQWRVHDPLVKQLDAGANDSHLTDDLDAVLDDADVAFLMTDHADYKTLSPSAFKRMRGNLIIDGRNILDVDTFQSAGFVVLTVGRGTAASATIKLAATG